MPQRFYLFFTQGTQLLVGSGSSVGIGQHPGNILLLQTKGWFYDNSSINSRCELLSCDLKQAVGIDLKSNPDPCSACNHRRDTLEFEPGEGAVIIDQFAFALEYMQQH